MLDIFAASALQGIVGAICAKLPEGTMYELETGFLRSDEANDLTLRTQLRTYPAGFQHVDPTRLAREAYVIAAAMVFRRKAILED